MATRFKFEITDLNYDSLLSSCKSLATTYFPAWMFDNLNDLGRFVLDLYLHALDRALWLANAWANEWNIMTARERKNIEARARSLGYPVKSLIASTGSMSISFASSSSPRTVLAGGIRLSIDGADGNRVYFENSADISIPALTTTADVPLVCGRLIDFTAIGTGRPFQELVVPEADVIHDSVKVKVGGVDWTEVQALAGHTAGELIFVTEPVGDNQTRIVFGDGATGAVPGISAEIEALAKVGGGTRGNMLAAAEFKIENAPFDLTIVSHTALTGGDDLENVDKIRMLAPLHRRMYDRIGTVSDAEIFVESVSGVSRAKAYLMDRTLWIHPIASGGGLPSPELIDDVESGVTTRLLMGYDLMVTVPTFKTVAMTLTGEIREGLLTSEVEASLTADIQHMLNPESKDENGNYLIEFGKPVYLDDVYAVILRNGSLKPGFQITSNDIVNAGGGVVAVPMTSDQIVTDEGSTITFALTGGLDAAKFRHLIKRDGRLV